MIPAKPQTFMNLSGESVRELVNYYKIDEKQELVVIYDDISMETGRLRIRKKAVRAGITVSKILLPIWDMIYFCGLRSGSGQASGNRSGGLCTGAFYQRGKGKN